MSSRLLQPLLIVMLLIPGYGQVAGNGQTSAPTANRHVDPPQTQPVPVPSPKDMPIPDGSMKPKPAATDEKLTGRLADKVTPVCLDMVFHTCWFARLPDVRTGMGNPKFSKNMEVGNFYLTKKNYRGAEGRFRDALELKPLDPEANFKLATALEKQGVADEAREKYQAYLRLSPEGPFAAEAKKALERLQPKPPSAAPDKAKQQTNPEDSHPH